MQIIHQLTHPIKREPLVVKGEDLPPIHVIDICPHSFQRNISLTVVVNDLSNVEDVLVAISALVELILLADEMGHSRPRRTYTKRPIAHHSRKTDYFSILDTDFLWSRTSQEVKVKNTTQDVIFEILFAVTCLIDFDIHTIRVKQEHSMCTQLTTVVVVHWVGAIQI